MSNGRSINQKSIKGFTTFVHSHIACYTILNVEGKREMPPKVRQLKAALSKAGFLVRPAKGSHTMWIHPAFPDLSVTVSGKDGDDAKPYQVRDVQNTLKRLEGRK
jgi:predicted RNA binding protein YcfA (HicA-like mRNA interferase family)